MITNYTKQEELIVPHEFHHRINVIGCGALGSWLVLFLLKMGFEDVHVYDFDTVEEHNIPNQVFKESDIGCLKVSAMSNIYGEFFKDEGVKKRLTTHNEKICRNDAGKLRGIVFSAVDSMKARKEIYEHSFKYGFSDLWLEARIGLEGAYVYMLDKYDLEKYEKYEGTLYEDTEAELSACGVSQTALPAAVNCASIMIMQMIRWHKGEAQLWKIEYSVPELVRMVA